MKLLLTSGGITNQSMAEAFFELLGKPTQEASVAFIPTASNVEEGDKGWVIKDLLKLTELNFKTIDIVDISALDRELWLPRLKAADVLLFEGGNTFHLMESLNRSGLVLELPELLKTKVYVGISAGSMVTCPDLVLRMDQKLYEESLDKKENLSALGYVGFYLLPHLNSPYFPKLKKYNIEEVAKVMKEKIYVLDDESAIKVDGEKLEVISEGEWFVLN